jgi:CBS domain-containing protein
MRRLLPDQPPTGPARRAGQVMTTGVVTVAPDTGYKELVRILHDYRIGAVPVVDDEGTLLGIVSEADLVLKEELPPAVRPPAPARRPRDAYAKAGGWTAAELMSAPVVTVPPDATLAQVARLLHSRRIRHVPVTGPGGRLLGIVSLGDLLDPFLVSDAQLCGAIRCQVIDDRPGLVPGTVDVAVADGVVTLSGRIPDAARAAALIEDVATFDGVVGVDDQLARGSRMAREVRR